MHRSRALAVFRTLSARYDDAPGPRHFIPFSSPFQALIGTMLSAQTTDRAVNGVIGDLFSAYPTPEALAGASPGDLEDRIRSIGLYRTKARNIRAAARKLVEEYDGEVPRTMEDLVTLPGVGRKTANIVLSHAFSITAGIAVDTHVARVSRRIGFTDESTTDRIEQDLMALFPREYWGDINYVLIRHGRAICRARKPRCPECPVSGDCRYFRETGRHGG
ncbi:MAG: endonuclease III [Methanomicrobiales archaeon]|nr:endonuclease III [Methanomicrobiales archaeon]